MRRRPAVQQAFDEARFGATRILNVRDPMLSGAEAVRRAEGWLRAKQVECAGEVLIVTGRGAGSVDHIAVVREEVRKLLARLRRGGVVSEIVEHTPGSFAVRLAPMRALFEAAPRLRDTVASRGRHHTNDGGGNGAGGGAGNAARSGARGRAGSHAASDAGTGARGAGGSTRLREEIAGLAPGTRELLRRLAVQALNGLGLANPDERFVQDEMARKFSLLTRSAAVSGTTPSEEWLHDAVVRALDEYENDER